MRSRIITSILIFILLSLFSISLQSQDLIVTSEGDSLNCKITNVKSDFIYFTFLYEDQARSTLLQKDQVVYQYNYFQEAEVPANMVVGMKDFPRFRAAFNFGWSYRLSKVSDNIPSDFRDYMQNLRSGYMLGLEMSYFMSKPFGLGVKYSVHRSKNDMSPVTIMYENGYTRTGQMSDNISISFIGPTFTIRGLNKDMKNSFIMSIGLGYLAYKDVAVLIDDFTLKGSTMGLCWDIGYDIGLSKGVALGFMLSLITGKLTSYDISDGFTTQTIKLDSDEQEGLSRIDLSIGLRFIR